MRWTGNNEPALRAFTENSFRAVVAGDRGEDPDITGQVFDRLHSTWVGMKTGDWVVRGLRGEFHPHDHDLLKEAYDLVHGEPAVLA